MRRLLFILLLLPLCLTAQIDTSQIKKVTIRKKFKESDLFPRLAGKVDGLITIQEILSDPKLKTKSNIEIASFDLNLRLGSGNMVYHSTNNELSSFMLDKISNLKKGEFVLFNNILFKHSSGKLLKLQPLRLVLR